MSPLPPPDPLPTAVSQVADLRYAMEEKDHKPRQTILMMFSAPEEAQQFADEMRPRCELVWVQPSLVRPGLFDCWCIFPREDWERVRLGAEPFRVTPQ